MTMPLPSELRAVRNNGVGIAAPFNFMAPPSWQAIVKLAALKHGVARREIMSRDRTHKVVVARYQAMRLIDTHCRLSAGAIGRLMDRDRTTVLYAIGRAPSRQRKLKRYRDVQ